MIACCVDTSVPYVLLTHVFYVLMWFIYYVIRNVSLWMLSRVNLINQINLFIIWVTGLHRLLFSPHTAPGRWWHGEYSYGMC